MSTTKSYTINTKQETKLVNNLKIVIIGDPKVGKTSLSKCYTGKKFQNHYYPTLGADFNTFKTKINNLNTLIALWDLSGQKKFRTSQFQYFVGSHSAIVVYDIEAEKPLENLIGWINEYIEYSGNTSEPIFVVQNKIDLLKPHDEAEYIKKHKQIIERLNIYYHRRLRIFSARVSAKTSENVKFSFNNFFNGVIQHFNENRNRNVALGNQIKNGLYSKSSYLMFLNEEYGPMIVHKSPFLTKNYTTSEMAHTVRLFSVLDYDTLIKDGFRFGLAPWSAEDANIYYIAFTIPNKDARGGHYMFIISISIGKDFSNLLANHLNPIEGLLLNTMNIISDQLKEFEIEIDYGQTHVSIEKSSLDVNKLEKHLHNLRIETDSIIRDLL